MLSTGAKAPDFHLNNEEGNTISNAGLEGQRFVLYFYPKDDTPGCTKEACGFRDHLPKFDKLNIPVFGISADDEKAHAKFVKKYNLNFSLLADPDHKICEAFGTWVEKSMYGKKYFGIQRSTFVIAANGKIEKVWEKVSPETHAEEVLAYLSGDVGIQKTAVKKSPAAKVNTVKKAPAKKAAVKKAVAKKAATKKLALKKTAPKKAASKKAPAKKTSLKKSVPKKKTKAKK
jgi:thioredoxin-dependent peroxiredoxin